MVDLSDIAGRWTPQFVLKRDVFSSVERGLFKTSEGEVEATLRHLSEIPWWSSPLAYHLLAREKRGLAAAGELAIAPKLLAQGRGYLVRTWIDGVPLHVAKPTGDLAYFKAAKKLLRALHRRGISHNDLAKEQNWLRGTDGLPYLTDFQLAMRFRQRSRLFRLAAYEDLRHLLKHKRRYAPEALTSMEQRILSRKSIFTRVWMATGKKLYILITRGIFNFVDREGSGLRLVNDAPAITKRLREHADINDAAVVAYPDRQAGTGLYAFVEASRLSEDTVRDYITQSFGGALSIDKLQIVDALPRNSNGDVRAEILQLIAMNQVDQIPPLIISDSERETIAKIIDARLNLRDKFAF